MRRTGGKRTGNPSEVGAARAASTGSSSERHRGLSDEEQELAGRAAEVLLLNDAGEWTTAAPTLYPHQWSWDAAIVSVGLAHLDPGRAMRELDRLFAAQWKSGKIPHIVFDPEAAEEVYFPGPARWDSARISSDAPEDVATSAICQPPVHALAALEVWETARSGDAGAAAEADEWLARAYRHLLSWHRYLSDARDPEGSGLVTIFHPWESGLDNSPRWDFVIGRLVVAEMPPYTRYDVAHVGDPSQRPSDNEYDCYVWLLERLKDCAYDERRILTSHPFRVKDVLFSGILVAANDALTRIADAVGAPEDERRSIAEWAERGREGLRGRAGFGRAFCYDFDVADERELRATTIANLLAPLLARSADSDQLGATFSLLDSALFLGRAGLRWRVPPTTSPEDPGYRPRSYWRGPTWPVVNWLLERALRGVGAHPRADALRAEALRQVAEGGFAEYFEPTTGEPLGSQNQAWTAAVTLDWLLGR